MALFSLCSPRVLCSVKISGMQSIVHLATRLGDIRDGHYMDFHLYLIQQSQTYFDHFSSLSLAISLSSSESFSLPPPPCPLSALESGIKTRGVTGDRLNQHAPMKRIVLCQPLRKGLGETREKRWGRVRPRVMPRS